MDLLLFYYSIGLGQIIGRIPKDEGMKDIDLTWSYAFAYLILLVVVPFLWPFLWYEDLRDSIKDQTN